MARYKKGQSGNPAGRPKGIPDKRVAYRQAIESRAEELIKKTVDLAMAGDMAALRLCIDRICPAIKFKDEPVQIESFDGELADKGEAVLNALASGTITPDESASVMRTLSAQAKIVETDELIKRIEALEVRVNEH